MSFKNRQVKFLLDYEKMIYLYLFFCLAADAMRRMNEGKNY